jgi:hypothetical protein
MLGAIRWDGAVARGVASGACVVVVVGTVRGCLDESIKGRFKVEESGASKGCMIPAEIRFF